VLNFTSLQGDHKILKNCQNFQKIAQKVAKSKKAKICTTKLYLKAKNIYIIWNLKSSPIGKKSLNLITQLVWEVWLGTITLDYL
jgi:hypothetical protein